MRKRRLKGCGRKQHVTYPIVAIHVRSRRQGRKVGFYNPINNRTYLNAPAIFLNGVLSLQKLFGTF